MAMKVILKLHCSYVGHYFIVSAVFNAGAHKFRASKFCAVAPTLCGSLAQNLLQITVQASTILRWLLDFCFFENLYTPDLVAIRDVWGICSPPVCWRWIIVLLT